MLRRPRRLRDDAKDGHAADVVFNVHVPMRKRLMFFAKIDADDVADRLSKIRLPASVVKAFQDSKIEIPDTIRKAYDDFQNPTFQPDRRRLSSVEDFFRYTEEEGACVTNVGSDGNPMGIRIPLRSSPPRPRTRRFMMTHTDYSFLPRTTFLRRDGPRSRRQAEAG